MLNHKKTSAVVLLLLLLSLLFLLNSLSAAVHDDEKDKEQKTVDGTIPFPFPTSLPSTYNYFWKTFKAALSRFHSYFFPPNLDFRGSGDEAEEASRVGGTGERVKEAVAKSLGKSKSIVEESAKSAAELAADTVQGTAKKVKKGFSSQSQNTHAEL